MKTLKAKTSRTLELLILPGLLSSIQTVCDALPTADLPDIEFSVDMHYLGGQTETMPYRFFAGIRRTDFTDVTVTPPGKSLIALAYHLGARADWEYEAQGYLILAAIQTDFPAGDHAFIFNDGTDSVTVYSGNQSAPGGFANLTFPSYESTDVSLTPIFTRGSVTGYGDFLHMELGNEEDSYWQYDALDIAETNWTIEPLNAGHLHNIEVHVATWLSYDLGTLQNYPFTYNPSYDYDNELFTTAITEPCALTITILSIGVLGLFHARRKFSA